MSVKAKPLVAVAMSGGVDSSVAAHLLKESGYEIVGLTMMLSGPNGAGENLRFDNRFSSQAVEDAKSACVQIGAPHHLLDLSREFKEQIVDDFYNEYINGRTPNPCVRCNPMIKWKYLWEKASELGAELFATGHYAQVIGGRRLIKGKDRSKDQSYALWGLTSDDLRHTLFPLGKLAKEEVRQIAGKNRLKVAEKRESQEVCFIPDKDIIGFLLRWGKNGSKNLKPGPIYDLSGEIIGEHKGCAFYTVGQRGGLGIAFGSTLYVVKIDASANALYVGSDEDLFSREFEVAKINSINPDFLERQFDCQVKIRYRHNPAPAKVSFIDEKTAEVAFDQPQRAITPGQSAVFYDGEEVLGGGIIEKVSWRGLF
jgi:tRNA-specific 2-thiouridylase